MPDNESQRTVQCIKLNKELSGLDEPPLANELGSYIFENISKEAWDQWLQESTRIINTYRLNLADASAREKMLEQLRIWLGLEEGQLAQTAWTPPTKAESSEG